MYTYVYTHMNLLHIHIYVHIRLHRHTRPHDRRTHSTPPTTSWCPGNPFFFFFFITLKPRVEEYTKSMSLKYEPASKPLHISVK